MNSLLEDFKKLQARIDGINLQIANCEKEIASLTGNRTGDIPARIKKLNSLVRKIDEYLPKVVGYQELAKRYLESQNVQTITAPEGYRVNLNRLKTWAQLIDPMASDDPYAQRVFATAKCDELFLKNKREEFVKTAEELRIKDTNRLGEEIQAQQSRIEALKQELAVFVRSEEFAAFLEKLKDVTDKYWHTSVPETLGGLKNDNTFAVGASAYFLNLPKDLIDTVMAAAGRCVDNKSGLILIPHTLLLDTDNLININCDPGRRDHLDLALRNILINMVDGTADQKRKIYIIDSMRMNAAVLGKMKSLENTAVLQKCPRNPEQIEAAFEMILSDFADYEDRLEGYDSVAEYNKSCPEENRISLTTIMILGCTNEFRGKYSKYLNRIMAMYEKFGTTLILSTYSASDKNRLKLDEFNEYSAININIEKNSITVFSEKYGISNQRYYVYGFDGDVPPSYISSIKSRETKSDVIGNEYILRYPLDHRVPYKREYAPVQIPFGIDGSDKDYSLSFENENFAAYLMGASRSGKSTLIHTIITGIIRNFHPDNVELWLADFKQLEFKRYMNPLPPHVKYILLDESTELVYDLVDKLTAEMLERQKILGRLKKQRIDEITVDEQRNVLKRNLPVIFVILDEFSIMSQVIAENDSYKLKLQNILAKGAGLGIKFLFASQSFETGIRGLTETAKEQIQQRIAMKNTSAEITSTLNLSSALKTEKVQGWIEALPPHYALVKYRENPQDPDDMPKVKRFHVMHIKDYSVCDSFINLINSEMHSSEKFNPDDINSYVEKDPVCVDGNAYQPFNEAEFLDEIAKTGRNQSGFLTGDETFVAFGTPRLMQNMKLAAMTSESRENILLIGRVAEHACVSSIILSVIKAFKLQGKEVEIWAYERDRVFVSAKQLFDELGCEVYVGNAEIISRMSEMRQSVQNHVTDERLVLMLGMDRVCTDFELGAVSSVSSYSKISKQIQQSIEKQKRELEKQFNELNSRKTPVQLLHDKFNGYLMMFESIINLKYPNDYDEEARIDEFAKIKSEFTQIAGDINKKYSAVDEKQTALDEEFERVCEKYNFIVPTPDDTKETRNDAESVSSDPMEDLAFLIRQASICGTHFMLHLNQLSDLSNMQGIKVQLFRYRLSFQISADDSYSLFASKIAFKLPEHICQFSDTLDSYSFRAYLHKGVSWDGWEISENGELINPYEVFNR